MASVYAKTNEVPMESVSLCIYSDVLILGSALEFYGTGISEYKRSDTYSIGTKTRV